MQIQGLKGQVSSLERQIRESVAGLAGVRGELLAAGKQRQSESLAGIGVGGRREDVNKADARPVPLSELLNYASRISRFTVPPAKQEQAQEEQQGRWQETNLEKIVKKEEKEDDERVMSLEDDTDKKHSPNGDLDAAATGKTPRVASSNDAGTNLAVGPSGDTGVGFAALTEPERNWQLQNTASLPFVPWPDDEMIRAGGLARVQSLLEKGEELEDLEKRGEARGDGDGVDVQGQPNQEQELHRRESAGMGSMASGAGLREPRSKQETPQGPAVFGGLDLYDPDEP